MTLLGVCEEPAAVDAFDGPSFISCPPSKSGPICIDEDEGYASMRPCSRNYVAKPVDYNNAGTGPQDTGLQQAFEAAIAEVYIYIYTLYIYFCWLLWCRLHVSVCMFGFIFRICVFSFVFCLSDVICISVFFGFIYISSCISVYVWLHIYKMFLYFCLYLASDIVYVLLLLFFCLSDVTCVYVLFGFIYI